VLPAEAAAFQEFCLGNPQSMPLIDVRDAEIRGRRPFTATDLAGTGCAGGPGLNRDGGATWCTFRPGGKRGAAHDATADVACQACL
jgi:hypothetical protein